MQGIDLQCTNLEPETRSIVRLFASISVVLCLTVAVVYGLTRGNWLNGALAGLALTISMVPEEFPVVLRRLVVPCGRSMCSFSKGIVSVLVSSLA